MSVKVINSYGGMYFCVPTSTPRIDSVCSVTGLELHLEQEYRTVDRVSKADPAVIPLLSGASDDNPTEALSDSRDVTDYPNIITPSRVIGRFLLPHRTQVGDGSRP